MPRLYAALSSLFGAALWLWPVTAGAQEYIIEPINPGGQVISATEGNSASDIISIDRDIGGGPSISLESYSHDFGRVLPGSTISHDFVFTNQGDSDLIISAVHPGCGCAVVNFDQLVKPGASGKITIVVTVYPSWAGSPFKRQSMVATNDPGRANVLLSFSGQVLQNGETL